jgi:hypothetical protein
MARVNRVKAGDISFFELCKSVNELLIYVVKKLIGCLKDKDLRKKVIEC